LVDPTASYASASAPARFTYADLPERIDWVLITHNHQDHFLLETLLQIRHKVGTVIVPRGNAGALEDPQLSHVLRALGFARVQEFDMLDSKDLPGGGQVIGVPFLGEHADLRVASKLAYVVELPGFRALFAADSNNLAPELYDHVRQAIGPTPVVFVGLECDGAPLSWLYGPLLGKPMTRKMDQSRRLSGSDFERADRLVQQMGAQEVFVYALGQEPWLGFIMSVQYTDTSRPIVCSSQLIEACRARGHAASCLYGSMEKVWGA
jgi:L-ascorbate metabolism protein UlaG (beta-lactamase superfamily)